MGDEIQSSDPHEPLVTEYMRIVDGEQVSIPEAPDNCNEFYELVNERAELEELTERENHNRENWSAEIEADNSGGANAFSEDNLGRIPIQPDQPLTIGELAIMPTFQHKFPNGEVVAAKIHPSGGGVVCNESDIGEGVYISKGSTVYKSKIEDGSISRSSISDCKIRTSNIVDSHLKTCDLSESCCNGLEANDSKFSSCTLTGSVSDSTLKNTFLTGAEVDGCKMEFCRLQGSYKESTLKSCVIIGTVSDCKINNSEITRAQLKGVKGHITDTGRTKRVQYFIVEDKIHVTYRANQSITLELDLTARDFRSQVRTYMERIGALRFNEEARKREIDWLCSNYKIFRKEQPAVEESTLQS